MFRPAQFLFSTVVFICIVLVFPWAAYADQQQDEYRHLDDLALKMGADKSSNYHNYTEVYARYFSQYRDEPIKFLEIGIDQGSSVKLWEAYFTRADLHFIDITFQSLTYFSNRARYYLADQSQPEELQKVMCESGGEFDIIIDDGGHTMNQQITSFRTLFPHVKSGGMYIIEDLHTSYWSRFGGCSSKSTVAFLKSLIDDVNFIGARTGNASHLNIDEAMMDEMNLFREKIYSIHFYDSLVVILKR